MREDNELKGEGNSLDFGARFYDPRYGKFLSLDPLYNKYPNISPYAAFANNPVIYIDPDGRVVHFDVKEKYIFHPNHLHQFNHKKSIVQTYKLKENPL